MTTPIQTDAIERTMRNHDITMFDVLYYRNDRKWQARCDETRGLPCTTPAAAINSLNQKLKEREKDNG